MLPWIGPKLITKKCCYDQETDCPDQFSSSFMIPRLKMSGACCFCPVIPSLLFKTL